MSDETKVLWIDCVNKIRYETPDKFKTSLFGDVYLRAKTLVSEIIIANRAGDKNLLDKEFCAEEQYSNIISFWGERGMGKSSAMLSFALFLKRYGHEEIDDLFILDKERIPQFYVLARVDAAMLVKGENLLDVILAKMWSDFEAAQNHHQGWNVEWENTKKKFENVKKSYDLYRGSEKSESFSMTSVRQLKELSKCLNLKNDFKNLVESYLDCMVKNVGIAGENFFVITIDDLDVVVDDVDSILEQIRMFLTIPRVIVLVTADYERLFLECNRVFSNRMINKENTQDIEKTLVRSYVDKYLAKIFPTNMRVYMPNLTGVNGVRHMVSFPGPRVSCFDSEKEIDEKRALFNLLYRVSGIMMNPYDYHRHLYQQSSLRTIVNSLYELVKLNNMESGKAEAGYSWMRAELEKYVINLDNISMKESGKILLETESQYIHEALNDELSKLNPKFDIHVGNYGEVIKWLLIIDNRNNHDFIHFVLCLYSIHVSNYFRFSFNKKNRLFALFTQDIFEASLEDNYLNAFFYQTRSDIEGDRKRPSRVRLSKDRISADTFMMNFLTNKKFQPENVFMENAPQIINVFKVYNLCSQKFCDPSSNLYQTYIATENKQLTNMKLTPGKKENNSEGEGRKIVSLKLTSSSSQDIKKKYYDITLESILNNFITYEKNLKDFCKNVIIALYGYKGEKPDNEEIERIIKNIDVIPDFKCDEYKNWMKKWKIKSILDLLPLCSPEVIFELVKKLTESKEVTNRDKSALTRILDVMKKYKDILLQELSRIEQYFCLDYEGQKLAYYGKIFTYIDKMKPFDIDVDILTPDEGDSHIYSESTADIL